MRTMKRLGRAREGARVVEFDKDSRIVIVSDAHRGDGSNSDEFRKNGPVFLGAMQHYFDEGYTLLEAGDMDDLWEFPRYEYITKANPLTFELLRKFHVEGRYLRMFGNHDMQLANPDYVRKHLHVTRNHVTGRQVPLFDGLEVDEAVVFRHSDTGQEILAVHGHQGDFSNDQMWWPTMWIFRIFWRHVHALGFRSPTSPVRNSFKRHRVERNYAKWIMRNGSALICGHTHRERFPRNGDVAYFNAGSCAFPDYITAIEIADDEISLVRWRVIPDANRYLKVERQLIAGPRPLSHFYAQPVTSSVKRPGKWLHWDDAEEHPAATPVAASASLAQLQDLHD